MEPAGTHQKMKQRAERKKITAVAPKEQKKEKGETGEDSPPPNPQIA